MRILIIGNGGREHALLWKLHGDEPAAEFFITLGNGGTHRLAREVGIQPTDCDGIMDFSKREKIDLVVVGPEVPLELGLTDRLRSEGVRVFGPGRAAARIETSKSFAKKLMRKYGIPTAAFETFTSYEKAASYIRDQDRPLVVKASGLAAGKGALVCESPGEALAALSMIVNEKAFGEAGSEVIVEEKLEGEELSFFVLTDGEKILPLPPSQDHKRIFDGDKGPNTGGMGAYAPVSIATPPLEKKILDEVVTPVLRALREEGCPYGGVLYSGLMINEKGPAVIEFNARFGDPEAQVVLPLISSNLVRIMCEVSDGTLESRSLELKTSHAVCVVLASGGYPGAYERGKEIHIPEDIESEELIVFHAGTIRKNGALLTSGGRVLGVTSLGQNIGEARERCYRAVGRVRFEGCHYRTDIASREMVRVEA
jgi:phosphoribosylamine--glycine ligase